VEIPEKEEGPADLEIELQAAEDQDKLKSSEQEKEF
jgi:hypothetical protein